MGQFTVPVGTDYADKIPEGEVVDFVISVTAYGRNFLEVHTRTAGEEEEPVAAPEPEPEPEPEDDGTVDLPPIDGDEDETRDGLEAITNVNYPPNNAPVRPITKSSLDKLLKSDLIGMAAEKGLDQSGTKADLIERILGA
jgi:hypothetical protein